MPAKRFLQSLSLLFPILVCETPAFAQTTIDKCTPPAAQSTYHASGADLLATYKCVSSAYAPKSSRQDVSNYVQDLESAGVNNLLTNNFGLTEPQRVLILNDYGFWAITAGGDEEPQNAVNALSVVTTLAPRRASAWLNLGDAYLTSRNNGALVFSPGMVRIPVSADETQRGERALSAYKRYLSLSPAPLQRVRDYVLLVDTNVPAGVGAWTTYDAIKNMVDHPQAAAIVLKNDNAREAKLALAMDLGLLLPNPYAHEGSINSLMTASTAEASASVPAEVDSEPDFNGKASSFVPYIQNIEQSQLQGEFQNYPIACQLLRKFPELVAGAEGIWGSNRDSFDPVVVCSDARLTLPASVQAFEGDLKTLSGFGNMCGSIRNAMIVGTWFDHDIVAYVPEELVPPYTPNLTWGINQAPMGQIEASALASANPPDGVAPLADWGETDIDSYQKARKMAADFHKAQADLAVYYRTRFGFSPSKAAIAAFHGVWLMQDAYTWAIPKPLDPLAEALLGHKPLPEVQIALQKETPLPDATVFLAIEYPEALKLVLAQKPDLNVTTPIGKTSLMEAAKYNQLESVKLLLAAGADVNAVSLAPTDIKNNATGELCTDGGYIITHGQRTALMYAAANASLPVIRALLIAGADKNTKDSMGATALDYLEGKGPVAKNPILNTNDFKAAEQLLAIGKPGVAIPVESPAQKDIKRLHLDVPDDGGSLTAHGS
jgi:hypothetical protein